MNKVTVKRHECFFPIPRNVVHEEHRARLIDLRSPVNGPIPDRSRRAPVLLLVGSCFRVIFPMMRRYLDVDRQRMGCLSGSQISAAYS